MPFLFLGLLLLVLSSLSGAGEDPEELYEVIEELGKGSYGAVYHAVNRATSKDVALKVLKLGEKKAERRKKHSAVACFLRSSNGGFRLLILYADLVLVGAFGSTCCGFSCFRAPIVARFVHPLFLSFAL